MSGDLAVRPRTNESANAPSALEKSKSRVAVDGQTGGSESSVSKTLAIVAIIFASLALAALAAWAVGTVAGIALAVKYSTIPMAAAYVGATVTLTAGLYGLASSVFFAVAYLLWPEDYSPDLGSSQGNGGGAASAAAPRTEKSDQLPASTSGGADAGLDTNAPNKQTTAQAAAPSKDDPKTDTKEAAAAVSTAAAANGKSDDKKG